ncbi:MAG: histidine kinase [Bacteroidetes bacterium]|nr:histidine kinase [Bacteroidota bacterium]MBU1681130.1 histidine kinase [Bacteroidota bacterium]MBU2506582.1 histidine kinase [Bacteroidota bacterium]
MSYLNRIKKYKFDFYHFIILIVIITISQITLSYINTRTTKNLIGKSIDIYRWDTAERIADLTTTSLELLMQSSNLSLTAESNSSSVVEALDFILTQQRLQKNIEDICLLFSDGDKIFDIDDGRTLYNYVVMNHLVENRNNSYRVKAKELFIELKESLFKNETVLNKKENTQVFHVLVPFSVKGEVIGAVYMKIIPDFTDIMKVITSSSDQTGALFSALILFSILLMFLITTFLVREMDQMQFELYQQREKQLTQKIEEQKEALFTKRIYHAQHKAEKIMGFIKQDISNLTESNFESIKTQIVKYANLVGRVIYDMKNFNPPVNIIRNVSFNTDLNAVIQFIIKNIFKRVYKESEQYRFELELDSNIPVLHINEYVIWEILEPLIQNCIDHNKDHDTIISIKTSYSPLEKITNVTIEDNGVGFMKEVLETSENGIKILFMEKVTTKSKIQNSGYGCYIAYENCKRCGIKIDAYNSGKGAVVIIQIPHN